MKLFETLLTLILFSFQSNYKNVGRLDLGLVHLNVLSKFSHLFVEPRAGLNFYLTTLINVFQVFGILLLSLLLQLILSLELANIGD